MFNNKRVDKMKRIILIIGLLVLISVESQSYNRTRVSFGFFYNSLAPYGDWIEIDRNFYVWKPMRIRYDWRPYSDGRWAWTRQGWYWVSYEPYGWAVFHYGRWHYDDYYGWVWIPGYDWSPAWVEWRYDDDYIGWAPLPPYATFNIRVGIIFTTHWESPVHHWSFVKYRHFSSPRVNDYYEPIERSQRFFGDTRYRSDYRYENERITNSGVDREFIERRTGERIRTADIIETHDRKTDRITREGDRPKIEVYRPSEREIERNRPERIEARKSDRTSTLELEKVDRTIYSERGTEKRDLRENEQPDDRRMQERKEPTKRGREIYREERNENRQQSEPRKRSERYRPQPEPERKVEERRPEIQKERQPEIQREESRRQAPEQRREIKPERREREIEIRREEVKPREYREEPARESRQRNEGQRDGGRESRARER